MPRVSVRANSDPLALFHPPVQEWFTRSFAAATRAQILGWPAIAQGDSTLILAKPKVGPHADVIRERVSKLLDLSPDRIGIKAKTPEGMGTDNAAVAHVVVLLERAPRTIRRKSQKKSQA